MSSFILGIDCATRAENSGFALAQFGRVPKMLEVRVGSRGDLASDIAISMIGTRKNVLIALDAPLGWPEGLARTLAGHQAGDPVEAEPNTLFRRHTDDVVARELGKRSLDVGADRIARTAHSALTLLQELRSRLSRSITLGWSPGVIDGMRAIEVYPAATLSSYGLPSKGYKAKNATSERRELTEKLRSLAEISDEALQLSSESDHALDALVCCVAGADYLTGHVIPVEDPDRAQREGWIWVRRP